MPTILALALGVTQVACGDDDTSSDESPATGAGSGGSAGARAGSGGSAGSRAGAGGAGGSAAAGSDADAGTDEEAAAGSGGAGGAGGAGGSSGDSLYGLLTTTSAGDESLTYVKTLKKIEAQTIDLGSAREFAGGADAWVWNGSLYIASAETVSITKYAIEGENLVEGDSVSFTSYGLSGIGFWVAYFASPTKAYVVNGTSEYIAWNPETMEITGTVEMPKLEERNGLKPFASYTDRSLAIRDGKIYHPFYYTSEDYFSYAPTSSIAVYDAATDKLEKVIEAPCPGIDHVTQDEQGNLFFSAWIFAPGGATVLKQPTTCVAKIAKGSDEATVAFNIKDVTNGLEGGVLRYTGDGQALLAALDPSHAAEADRGDVEKVTYGSNWKFWSYDFATNTAKINESIDWNSAGAYGSVVDGKTYILAPTDDYGSTTLYDISKPSEAKKVLDVKGWAMRLVKLR